MNRTRKMSLVIVVLGVAILAAACGGNGGDGPEPEPVRDVNILALLNQLGDMGYNDGILWELQQAAERLSESPALNVNVDVVEVNVGSGNERERIDYAFRGSHIDLVIAVNHFLLPFLEPAAANFPDKSFILLDMEAVAPNMLSAIFKPNESSFLCGALSALMSETGIIGIIIGADIPVLHDFAIGFIEGALHVNPDIRVFVDISGDFNDAERAYNLAAGQFERGADIIFGATGGASLGVLQAATDFGRFAIGVDLDQTEHAPTELRRSIITSGLKNFDRLIPLLLDEFLGDNLTFGQTRRFGLYDGAVGIARNEIYRSLVPTEIQAEIDALEAAIVSGNIRVSSALEMTRAQYDALVASVRP